MPTDPAPITVGDVVARAVAACELGEVDERLDDLLERFEDADEPVRSAENIELQISEAVGSLDADAEDPALVMAAAVSVYLAHRRDEIDADPATLLHLAARAEFDGEPPPDVARWLRDAGVEV